MPYISKKLRNFIIKCLGSLLRPSKIGALTLKPEFWVGEFFLLLISASPFVSSSKGPDSISADLLVQFGQFSFFPTNFSVLGGGQVKTSGSPFVSAVVGFFVPFIL